MWTVTQNTASNLHEVLAEGVQSLHKNATITLRISVDDYNDVRSILQRVMLGDLVEKPAALPQYTQPAMINDYEGSPLFSITEN